MDQHRSKRRKTKGNDPSVVKIGDKTISLSAFLAPPPAKIEEKAQSAPEENGPVIEGEKEEQARCTDEIDGHASRKRPQDGGKKPLRRSKQERDTPMLKARKALPIWAYRDEIKASLRGDKDILLVVGETGSGKSTQTPQFLCEEPWCHRKKVRIDTNMVGVGGMIAITQPRRVAATTLASRVAREMGTPLGSSGEGSVGYSACSYKSFCGIQTYGNTAL
ncbi:hypothetical protein ONZ43_g2981 [Nemania bipapillata]|uniref:Uncharacterized protein n=1 Tax=Nemania bipapillata TaxID=110536 RepID=A0ACC2IZ84_9PEZI|nr:hypothetical protein ONZ43_g2981 [Nemania bipapillata]